MSFMPTVYGFYFLMQVDWAEFGINGAVQKSFIHSPTWDISLSLKENEKTINDCIGNASLNVTFFAFLKNQIKWIKIFVTLCL